MALMESLHGRRAAILERWLQGVMETYPAETGRFFTQVKDPFANPVGATLSRELAVLCDGVLGLAKPAEVAPALESLIKLRSVQDFTASQVVSFIFFLKQIAREQAGEALRAAPMAAEWAAFDARVDDLALSAFDIYSANRETICDIRLGEMRRKIFMLEKASRLFDEDPEPSGS